MNKRKRIGKAHPSFKHGATCGRKTSKEYRAWLAMKKRCDYPQSIQYKDYGGRGIKVCDKWKNNFSEFLKDMGLCPGGCSIDRKDNNGDYEPNNCRWATCKEQNNNRRKRDIYGERNPSCKLSLSNILNIRTDKRTQTEIAKSYGVTQGLISKIKLRQIWATY